ncbi:MAG: molybdopterin-dependent oxidoreductase [Spirochaetes bacterium]|nr:molybdopterin-dependent oxidoreductase [Spirochaetota bacterium]
MKRLLPVFCGKDCGGDACPLMAEIDRGRVERIVHNEAAGPYLRGCPKGFALPSLHYSKKRIKTPLVRIGARGSGRFREASWDEAASIVAWGLTSCIERGGPASIMDLSSGGCTGAFHDTGRLTRRFLNLLGGCSVQEGNYSSNAADHALGELFGTQYRDSGFQAQSMTKSAMIVLWGANILEARLGAELSERLLETAERGARIVSIDPRYTRTARACGAEWLPILPGTDAALLYALLFLLDAEGLIDEAYVDSRTAGFHSILEHIRGSSDGIPKTAAWASAICGIGEQDIKRLAEAWASVKPLLLIPGYSIQRSAFGEETMRLCVALQLVSGNFGLEGGSTGSLNNRLRGPRVGRIAIGEGRVKRGFPVVRWPDRILEGCESEDERIRAVYSVGGNYLNQGADIGKSSRALETLEFMVCHELFLTPTAAYADIVLPAASPLQKEDIGIPWDGNYLLYKPKILAYEGLERSDYEIFRGLSDALGFEGKYSEGLNEDGWIQRFLEDSEVSDIEAFKNSGIYFGKSREASLLSRFATDPRSNPLGTTSGQLDFGHGSRATFEPREAGAKWASFLLVTPKRADRVHSQSGHQPADIFRSKLWINQTDAGELGIETGDRVILSSAEGTIEAWALPSENITRGVVALYEGVWHVFAAEAQTATGKLSSSPNVLTSTRGTDESVSCIMEGVAVRIEKAKDP